MSNIIHAPCFHVLQLINTINIPIYLYWGHDHVNFQYATPHFKLFYENIKGFSICILQIVLRLYMHGHYKKFGLNSVIYFMNKLFQILFSNYSF